MQSIYLAKLIGPVILVVGVALLVNQQVFREIAREVLASRALLFISGVLSVLGGVAVILAHNLWVADWRLLITLLGWLAAITGAVRLLAPEFIARKGSDVIRHPRMPLIGGAVWVILGLLFCFFGYSR